MAGEAVTGPAPSDLSLGTQRVGGVHHFSYRGNVEYMENLKEQRPYCFMRQCNNGKEPARS